MKKGYVLLVILIILVLMAGCGSQAKNSSDSSGSPTTQAGDSISTSSGGSSGGSADDAKDVTGKDAESGKTGVIAKSGSDVASKDKAVLLNEIDQELDQMINDMNNLEDISDSDLQY